jgi:hypothetical protein
MISATEVVRTAAQGPSTIATSVPPTPCAVVPPGTGTLNIMMANWNAANMESSGTVRPRRILPTRETETAQNGVAAAYITPEVAGLR